MTDPRFAGIDRLLGQGAVDKLAVAHVAVIGVGGVGSWAAEALARSGVGRITLIDLDDVCETNTNRQVHALTGTVGRAKVDVLAERIAQIAPEAQVNPVAEFFTAETADTLWDAGWSAVIDAIDDRRSKALLLARAHREQTPIVTCGAAGGRTDPTFVATADLALSTSDGLLKRVRKVLRREYGFPSGDAPWGITAVFSTERPLFPQPDGSTATAPDRETSLKLDCATGFGTASFVTGVFGFAAAGAVVRALGRPADSALSAKR